MNYLSFINPLEFARHVREEIQNLAPNYKDVYSRLGFADEDTVDVMCRKPYLSSVQEMISCYESGKMKVFEKKSEYLKWLYDEKTVADGIVKSQEQTVFFPSGTVVFFIE